MTSPTIAVAWVVGADPDLPLPFYQTDGAAGADVCANLPDRGVLTLRSLERKLVPTGLRMAIPNGFEVQVRPRSGLALKHGIALVNAPGTIDSDYRGPLDVILINLGSEAFEIRHGMRIAQLVVAPVVRACFELADRLDDTVRGEGGFGSTGTAS